jgi:hypothetical protein
MPRPGIFFHKKLDMELPSKANLNKLLNELEELNDEVVEVDGRMLKARQCYRYEISPPHVLFNTDCPEALKQKISSILTKYIPADESSSQ